MTTVQTRRASARQAAHRAKSDSDHLGALALSDGLSRDEEPLSRQANHDAIEARAGAAWSKATAGGGGEVPYRREMERAFGQDFSGVKAHVGRKAEMGEIQAKAATVGESVAFAESRPDKRLVAHELTHVVQNRRAKGGGGLRKKTSVSKPGDAAEVEADRMAERVVRSYPANLNIQSTTTSRTLPLQRKASPAQMTEHSASNPTAHASWGSSGITRLNQLLQQAYELLGKAHYRLARNKRVHSVQKLFDRAAKVLDPIIKGLDWVKEIIGKVPKIGPMLKNIAHVALKWATRFELLLKGINIIEEVRANIRTVQNFLKPLDDEH